MTLTQLARKILSDVADEQVEFILEEIQEFDEDTDLESEVLEEFEY